MRSIFFLIVSIIFVTDIIGQNVEARIVVDNSSTAANTIVQFQVKTKTGTENYVGVNMYMLYQESKLVPQSTGENTVVGINDALLTNTYGWGTSLRTTTPYQSFGPATFNGQSYNRRFVYINEDETGGSNVKTLTTTWLTLFTVTFNNLLGSYPQGGYGFLQETAEFINASLTNDRGVNIPIDVITGSTLFGFGSPSTPDLTGSQFYTSLQLSPGSMVEQVISVRNVGSAPTSGLISFTITNYSPLTGLTITPLSAGTNVTIGIDIYTITAGWTFNPSTGTFTSSNVIPPGGNNFVGIRITRGTGPSMGANGTVTQTTTIASGTGGGETPALNNSISNSILKF